MLIRSMLIYGRNIYFQSTNSLRCLLVDNLDIEPRYFTNLSLTCNFRSLNEYNIIIQYIYVSLTSMRVFVHSRHTRNMSHTHTHIHTHTHTYIQI